MHPQGKKGWVPHAPFLVECVRKFLRYGVTTPTSASTTAAAALPPQPATRPTPPASGAPTPAPADPPPRSSGGGGRYCPPHLRNSQPPQRPHQHQHQQPAATGAGGWHLSDSDVSDNEGGANAQSSDRWVHKGDSVSCRASVCFQCVYGGPSDGLPALHLGVEDGAQTHAPSSLTGDRGPLCAMRVTLRMACVHKHVCLGFRVQGFRGYQPRSPPN